MAEYYSTQTSLADHLAEAYYREYFVYVAAEFNPSENDPTSNPSLIREQWCEVATGNTVLSAEGDDVWFDHREKLKRIAQRREERNRISAKTKEEIQLAIMKAQYGDAAPVVYHLPPRSPAAGRLQPGEHKSAYPMNVEYIITDLHKGEFTRHPQTCGEPSEFEVETKQDASS